MPLLFLGVAISGLGLALVLAMLVVRGATSGQSDLSQAPQTAAAAATPVIPTSTPAVLVSATLDAQATAQTRGTTAAAQQGKDLDVRVQTAIAAAQTVLPTAVPVPPTPIVIVVTQQSIQPVYVPVPVPAPGFVPANPDSTMVVNKRYGAALRASPSSGAAIVVTLGCGSPLQVVSGQDSNGWMLIRSDYSQGWVGGVRLRVGPVADPGVCAGAPYPPYSLGQYVQALVQTGCLSVRPSPSANAAIAGCVESGHSFQITNGPIEVDGEDWFAVRSTSTGLSGWTRAQYLVR